MRRSRKGLIWAAAFFVGIWVLYRLLAMDAGPPQDGHLLLKRTPIPDEQNGFALIAQAAKKVTWPEDEKGANSQADASGGRDATIEPGAATAKGKAHQLDNTIAGTAWDTFLAAEAARSNEEALKLWEGGMACPQLKAPAAERHGDLVAGYPDRWVLLGKVVCLRAQLLAHQGKPREALDEAMKAFLFGHRAEGAQGSVTLYQAGTAIKHNALLTLRDVATRGGVPAEALKEFIRQLAKYRSNTEGLADAFRVEYTFYAKLMDDIKKGNVVSSRTDPSGTRSLHEVYLDRDLDDGLRRLMGDQGRIQSPYLFQPNRTKAALAERFGDFMAQIPRHYSGMSPALVGPDPDRAGGVRLLMPNAAGRELCRQLGSNAILGDILQVKCRENQDVEGARVMLALFCYAMEKGAAASSLQDLVPDYLDAVPVDDMTGQPMVK